MKRVKHIHILSPSGAIERNYVDDAAAVLRAAGFEVTLASHVYERYGRFAGTPEQRLEDINNALQDSSVDILLCSRGGYGMAQIVDKIRLPQTHCPLVVGFSDITCFHNLFGTRNIPSLHALMTKHIATLPADAPALTGLFSVLADQPVRYLIPPCSLNRAGRAEGFLRGGNLSVLYGLQGTPYAVQKGGILFIEDIAERHYHIDRMMQNLRLSGVLANLSGLVVGRFADCDDDPLMQQTVRETVLQSVAEYDYPVVFDFPAGHIECNLPLVLNHPCRLMVTDEEVLFEQPEIQI